MGRRVPSLEASRARRGMYIEFYDPEGTTFGLPTYPYRYAPEGLLTVRQLRAEGLRPGGQPIVAQIMWRHRNQRRVAYLYDRKLALPKRTASPLQQVAIALALEARMTCPTCKNRQEYYIRRSWGECADCHNEPVRSGSARRPARPAPVMSTADAAAPAQPGSGRRHPSHQSRSAYQEEGAPHRA